MRLFLNAILSLLAASSLFAAMQAAAATATATITSISATGIGAPLGTVFFMDSAAGLVITPKVLGLPPGNHGFHIHEKGDCGPGDESRQSGSGLCRGRPLRPCSQQKASGSAQQCWPSRGSAGAGG